MTERKIDFRYSPSIVWTSICRPDDPHKSLVSEEGSMLYNFYAVGFQAWRFNRVFEFDIHSLDKPQHIDQNTESARVPIVITTLRYERATLELRAFGHEHDDGKRTDVVLWTIRAHDDVDELLTAFHVDAYEQGTYFTARKHTPVPAPANIYFAVNASDVGETDRWASANTLVQEDETLPAPGKVAFVNHPQTMTPHHTGGFRPVTGLSTQARILTAGETYSGAFMIPVNHEETGNFTREWALAALETERSFWGDLSLMKNTLKVPDSGVMDMITACARNILQAREIEDGLPVYKVGPTVYRNLFVVDGHFFLEAAQYLGDRDAASQAIDTLLRRVHDDGSIYEMAHHTKETGISIATLVRQTELLGDDDRLRSLWDIIKNAVTYIEGLRKHAKQLPSDDPCYNLLPQAYGDGGVGGDRGEYTTTFWIMFGLKAAADAAKRLGFEEDATRFQQDFDELMQDFRDHAARNMHQLDNGTPYLPIKFDNSSDHHWIPDYPDDVNRWNELQPQSATWALCQAIYPGEVFAPYDPITVNLLKLHDQVDDEEGIPIETGWLPYKSMWPYHSAFAANAWLYANRPDKAVDYLYDFANHASNTRVWREEQSLHNTYNGQIFGDMPHNWASAEFIRLVRNLLIFERGETLELLSGLPSEWSHDEIVVEAMPTKFGTVNLHVTFADEGQVTIEYTRATDGHREPQSVKLFIPGMSNPKIDNSELAPLDGAIELPDISRAIVTARLE